MKKIYLIITAALYAIVFSTGVGMAEPDLYTGDTSIYGGSPVSLDSNVLIIIDSSGSMKDPPPVGTDPYDPAIPYPDSFKCGSDQDASCVGTSVYKSDGTLFTSDITNVAVSCSRNSTTDTPRNNLLTFGFYNHWRLLTTGTCNTSKTGDYLYGNYINWDNLPKPPQGTKSKIDIARSVISTLINATTGVKFGVMKFHKDDSWPYSPQGAEFLTSSISGTYVATLKKMDDVFSGSITNRMALVSAITDTVNFQATGGTPLGESLVEAIQYFKGEAPLFGSSIGVSNGTYTSPIEYSCQKNFVIFITDGESRDDNSDKVDFLTTAFSGADNRYDGGGCTNPPYTTCANNRSHSLAGAAKYLYEKDLSSLADNQNVTTYTIGFGFDLTQTTDITARDLLLLTADSKHGRGAYFDADSETELSRALRSVMAKINATDTSYVAPVVPVSPENRTYSGSKVYMGFFKPLTPDPWKGNLKKYGLHPTTNAVVDKNGNPATDIDGKFSPEVVSYWSTTTSGDGAIAEKGGVGALLKVRDLSTRKIYTIGGTTLDPDLTAFVNAFTTTNTLISTATLSVGTTGEKDDLINFIWGYDTYKDNNEHSKTDNRDWIMGDILHSKPLIVHYTRNIPPSDTTVDECTWNKSYIYVGANDGMMHAFRDCDGQEEWAFIPPDVLPNLRLLAKPNRESHPYFVDASPSVYVYDANKNSIIESGDKVMLMFGERRGGGYYYALDITDPVHPVYKWRIGSAAASLTNDAVYANLAETWSEPKIVTMMISGTAKIVAVFGAGYNNVNEDSRYGATQTFKTPAYVDLSDPGNKLVTTSSGTAAPSSTKGRGIYLAEIAYLTNGVPTFYASPPSTFLNTGTLGSVYSIPSEVHTVDTNGDGYIDRLYAGDTGGNIWRVNETSTSWTISKIFSANSGTFTGRKIFYKPDVGIGVDGNDKVYFGTGDREHPLNKGVVDVMYGFWDKNDTVTKYESDMKDVTTNDLQLGATTAAEITTLLSDISSGYGWYIKLDQRQGEKVLAPSRLLNGVAYFTTYAPASGVVTDPCSNGNIGSGHLYAVDYGTGEAILNFDATNDTNYSTLHDQNLRATPSNGIVLQRSDRELGLPSGIPSGLVIIVSASGEASGLISAGDSLIKLPLKSPSVVFPLYWRIL